MKKILRSAYCAIAAAVVSMAALTSCGGSDSMKSQIPADIEWAVKVDLTQFIDNAGGAMTSEGELEFKKLSEQIPEVNFMLAAVIPLIKTLDLSAIVVFGREKNDVVLVSQLRDADAAKTELSRYLQKKDSKDGYDIFKLDRHSILAIKGDMLYVSENLENISKAAESASSKNIAELPAIENWLTAPGFVSVVASPATLKLPSNFSQYWLIASAELQDQTASGEIALMDVDGNRYNFGEAFGEVDTDFLKYIPESTDCVMALGKIESPELKKLIETSTASMGSDAEMLTNLDGTISLSVAVAPDFNPIDFVNKIERGRLDLSALDFIAMIHYPKETINNMVQKINDIALHTGQIAKSEGNGMYSILFDGTEISYGDVDGYFTIADYDFMKEGNQDYEPLVKGTRGVIASIQNPGENPNYEWGSMGRIWLTADAVKGEIKVTNTDSKFLELIIEVLSDFNFQELINQSMGAYGMPDESFGGYDDDEAYTMTEEEEFNY